MAGKFDWFAGELLSIQPAEGGYYAELPELNWSTTRPTYMEAYGAALDRILDEPGGSGTDIASKKFLADSKAQVARLKKGLADARRKYEAVRLTVDRIEGEIAENKERLKETEQKLEDASGPVPDTKQILEQESQVRRFMDMMFSAGKPEKHVRAAVRIYRDMDGDGDLDVMTSYSGSRKRLVSQD
jgi:hypothetical protein